MNQTIKKLYVVTSVTECSIIPETRYKNILISFAYYKGSTRKYLLKNRHKYDEVLMDSGAFTFWNSGKDSSDKFQSYMDTLKRDDIKKYIAYDVISDPKKTKENYLIMRKNDLNPIPCFHINTNIDYLKYYLDECDHISIGGMVSSPNIQGNLDKIWSTIINRHPKCKVHGLGVSNSNIIIRYPWYSVDSSSYLAILKFRRASIWRKTKFDIIHTYEWLRSKNLIDPEVSEFKLNQIQNLLTFWQIEQYNQMVDYCNDMKIKMNYTYLTNQQTLF